MDTPRVKSQNVASWKIIPDAAPERDGGLHFSTNCNHDINATRVGNLPPFYIDALKEWQMTKDSIGSDSSLAYQEVIWNNRTF